ncbi:glycosylphosphatidylinositol anchor biosynthesis [Apophysomyces sp. BC1034]|nr:glycosylphosphatidylinositol anchor biosynthesis [Apophysomyces sp. BC1015]KAG0178596.1 glycosylphosphatidylinositol anchor biosynthesis [Apophysomyces sp. BC1021]KAG0188939.1 glycosylphosphatidylinositol anchor biosynthesis [Apophysomyces sp. BC1034]
MYRTVKRLGIPDSNIILMLADDVSCNSRNKYPATVYNNAARYLDLYGDNVEVDYRGYEVTVENFIRMLTGRVSPSTPRSKRLLSDDRSNILVYMTGHGGDEFLKFQDAEEVSAYDLADAFKQMWEKKRYNEILFMIDTCQANTMYSQFDSPNILATGSSKLGENSYSAKNIDMTSNKTLKDLFDTYDPEKISSHPGIRSDLFSRPLDKVKVTDFFGNVQNVELTRQQSPLVESDEDDEDEEDETHPTNPTLNQHGMVGLNQTPTTGEPLAEVYGSFEVKRIGKKTGSWFEMTTPSAMFGILITAVIGYVISAAVCA